MKETKNASHVGKTIRFMMKHVMKLWPLTITMVSLIFVAKIIDILVYVQYKDFINALTSGTTTRDALMGIIVAIFALNFTVWVCWRFAEGIINYWQPKIMQTIYDECFVYLHKHSYNFFVNNFAGSLVKRLNRLPTAFESISDVVLFNLYTTAIQIFASLYVIYTIQPILSGLLAIWIVVFIGANWAFSMYKMRYDNRVNELDSKVSGLLSDTIANNFNITLFGKLFFETKKFEKMTDTWRRANTTSWNWGSVGNAAQALLMISIEFLIFYVGIGMYEKGELSVGDFVLIQNLLLAIFMQIWDFGRNIRKLSRSFSDADEMIQILHTKHEISDTDGAKRLKVTAGDIDIKDLTFGYNSSKNIFENFDLHIPAKRKVAFVSRSGEGKSTLIKLLMRLYNIPENKVFIDGQDIMQVTQESLREAISFVPQDPVLFHRTLKENISYGKPEATMEEIVDASKKAHCHEFISKLPEGYDTYVGERGVKLSGGERQRVAIARAILENAPLLVLDEATSALDSESEQYIQDALKILMKNKTSIVIAHRLSTINQMDEIIVIEQGRISERGTHDQLLERDGGHYRMLWEIQAGGFDAEE